MKTTTKSLLMSAIVTGLMGGYSLKSMADDTAASAGHGGDGFQCEGANSCKGKGDCGGKGHSCAGKNECKGKGWVKAKDEADCKMMKEKSAKKEDKKKKS